MKRVLAIFLFCLAALGLRASVANVYIAQNAVGGDTGVDAANAHGMTWINNAANWGAGAAQVGAGSTVHLCGTITNSVGAALITPKGNGSAGSPITFVLELGCQLNNPAWGTTSIGCFQITNLSYITIDGGATNIVQNTDNGSGLTYSNASTGIYIANADHITVQNVWCRNIYQNGGSNPAATDVAGANTHNVKIAGNCSYITIQSNVLDAARSGIRIPFDAVTMDNIDINGNLVRDHCWAITTENGSATGTMTNEQIRHNTITGWSNWQYPSASYHTDGIIVYTSAGAPSFVPRIWGNYLYGNLGAGSPTAFIYSTRGTGSSPGVLTEAMIYNNLIVATNGASTWGIGTGVYTTNQLIANNTIIGCDTGYAIVPSGDGIIIHNNAISHFARALFTDYAILTNVVSTVNCDYNVYANIVSAQLMHGTEAYYTWAAWRALGYDTHSSTNAIALMPTWPTATPVTVTPTYAWGYPPRRSGLNLSAQFTNDINSVQRAGVNPWAIGAGECPIDLFALRGHLIPKP